MVKGSLSFAVPRFRSTYGKPLLDSSNAEFCYSVFLRHASYLPGPVAGSVAELGPGGSIGVGLAALIAGADSYTALDSHWHMDVDRTLQVFERLVALFRARTPIPAEGPHATTFPPPHRWGFPDTVTPRLDPAWLSNIERAIRTGGHPVHIAVPWETTQTIAPASVDWLFSHSCLEHIDRIGEALDATHRWLRPGALATHEIDHRSHNLGATWDSHWGMSPAVWHLLRGRRHYLINRRPHSFYIERQRTLGFVVEHDIHSLAEPHVTPRPGLSVTEEDRHIAMSFVVARRPG